MKKLKSINVRYLSALVMFAIVIPVFYITSQLGHTGKIVGIVGYSLLIVGALYELAKSQKLDTIFTTWLVLYAFVVIFLPKNGFLDILNHADTDSKNHGDTGKYLKAFLKYKYLFGWETFAFPALGSLLILVDGQKRENAWGYIKRYLFITIATIFIPVLIKAMWIINIFSWKTLLFLLAIPVLADSFAYLGGTMFGKHKLAPKISPKKTWEGAITGWVFSVVWIAVAGYYLKIFDDHTHKVVGLICSCIVLPIVSPIGDLSFSLYKRQKDIKDFSQLIPGHGGILDRIDALLYVILFLIIIILVV